MELTTYLKTKRASKKLTQLQVGKALGYTSGQYFSDFERGVSTPPLNQVPALAETLGVEITELAELVKTAIAKKTKV